MLLHGAKIVKELFQIFCLRFSPSLFGLLSLPFWYPFLDLGEIGEYESAIFLSSIVVVLAKFSLPSVYFRDFFESNDAAKSTLISLELIVCFAYVLIVGFLAVSPLHLPMKVFLASSAGLVFFEVVTRDVQARQQYQTVAVVVFVLSGALQLTKYAVVAVFDWGVDGLLLADSIFNLSLLVLYLAYRALVINGQRTLPMPLVNNFLTLDVRYWAQLYIHHLASFGFQYLTKIIVLIHLSSEEMALLGFSFKLFLPFSMLVDVVCFAIVPRYFSAKGSYSAPVNLVMGFLILALTYYLLVPHLISLVFDDRFNGAHLLLGCQLIACIFTLYFRLTTLSNFYNKNLIPVIGSSLIPSVVVLLFFNISTIQINLFQVGLIFIFLSAMQVALFYMMRTWKGEKA